MPRALPGPAVSEPPQHAGGIRATVAITRQSLVHLGPWKALSLYAKMNQPGGFDCPGCAWPEPREGSPEHGARLEFCENGVKAVASEGTRFRADPAFFAAHSVAELAGWDEAALERAGRLTHPMVRRDGASHYVPISWDDAFAEIGRELRALPGPDHAIFYTSGRTSNEAAFLYQLFARTFGTNNLPDCSNLCHESSGVGLGGTIGVGKGSVHLSDFEHADLVLVVGQNPGTNHPRMLTTLQAVKRRGARIIAVNPLREAALLGFRHPKEVSGNLGITTKIADRYLQVRLGSDVALFGGLCKALLERDAVDHAFLERHATGWPELEQHLRALDWARIVADTGIPEAEIRAVADELAATDKIIVCWAMGLTQHVHGVANVESIVNLLLMRGAIGKRGAGACPVRGHSNVQGDRTMGIYEKPKPKFLDDLDAGVTRVTGAPFRSPRLHGHDVVDAIRALRDGTASVFVAMGGNFLAAAPDTEVTATALRNAALTVHVSTKLNRSHLVTGRVGLILPCLGRTERHVTSAGPQMVTVEDSMSCVHASQGSAEPASDALLGEPAIVARIAAATVGDRPIPWAAYAEDLDKVRDLVEASIPGFTDYNRRIREPGGFVLPHAVRDSLTFATPSGKAHLTPCALPDLSLEAGQLWMMTIRSHDQYNTTVYARDDRYRGLHEARRAVLLHPQDLLARGLAAGQEVVLRSHFRGEVREAKGFVAVPYDLPRGNAATYFPEANVLVPLDRTALGSQTPASKMVAITVSST